MNSPVSETTRLIAQTQKSGSSRVTGRVAGAQCPQQARNYPAKIVAFFLEGGEAQSREDSEQALGRVRPLSPEPGSTRIWRFGVTRRRPDRYSLRDFNRSLRGNRKILGRNRRGDCHAVAMSLGHGRKCQRVTALSRPDREWHSGVNWTEETLCRRVRRDCGERTVFPRWTNREWFLSGP